MVRNYIILLFLCTSILFPFTEKEDVIKYFSNEQLDKLSTKIILPLKHITKLNKKIRNQGFVINSLSKNFTMSKKMLRKYILGDIGFVKNNGKYNVYNKFIPEHKRTAYFKTNLNLKNIRKNPQKHYYKAVVSAPTLLRVLPSYEYRMRDKNDYYFDVLQISFLNIWDPLVVLHESTDKKWVYVQSIYSRGWVVKKNIMPMTRDEILKHQEGSFIVVTAAKVKIYNEKTGADSYLYMGDVLPIQTKLKDGYRILIPGVNTKSYFLPKGLGVSEKFLPLTQQNIAIQSHKMLGEKYSWGGYNGDTDCSGFIARVYAVFGLYLPRSSTYQSQIFKSRKITNRYFTKNLLPYLSLIRLKGHIMLYTGTYKGKHHVIHNVWKYLNKKNEKVVIGRVALTDLELGKGSKVGSLRKRAIRYATLLPN
jgi:hypothetical protein